jgi:hypothetical protein
MQIFLVITQPAVAAVNPVSDIKTLPVAVQKNGSSVIFFLSSAHKGSSSSSA